MQELKMDIRMVDLKGQYAKIKPEVDQAIQEVIDGSAFIKGPFVKRFQENLESFLQVDHVIPCGNGTDALQLALMALDLPSGSEVITTSFTFVATVEVICLLGLKPVFVDVDPLSFNLDASKIEAAITEKTRCIIPVHLFGQAADMTPIMAIAQKHQLKVIEDTAQAIGCQYNTLEGPQYCGTIADIGTFSFFPSKNLGCYGDGGAVCTNDATLAEQINLFGNHGSKKKYHYDSIGINSRLDGIQAAILDVKLAHLREYTRARVEAADRYDELLGEIKEIAIPHRDLNSNHVFHQYTIKVYNGKRDTLKEYLTKAGIPTAIYYPSAIHVQKIYASYHKGKAPLGVTEDLCHSVLSLPMHTELDWEMQKYITDHIKEGLKNA
jgi:dTDP-4-amino-4,6-dideoxygalactose transaminase